MPTIEFLENELGSAKTVEVPAGGELVDVCDYYLAPVPFSCRSASCATCEIEVVAGQDLLEPAEELERELLDVVRAPPTHRFACQVKVKAGPGTIRLRPAS